MNKQMIFDKVWRGLHAQGRQSLALYGKSQPGTGCAYRGDQGVRCAIGLLLPDQEYCPDFEGVAIYGLKEMRSGEPGASDVRLVNALAAAGLLEEPDAIEFLKDLQEAHDGCTQEGFARQITGKLRSVAALHNLEVPA